jgi:hypothetical protein
MTVLKKESQNKDPTVEIEGVYRYQWIMSKPYDAMKLAIGLQRPLIQEQLQDSCRYCLVI